VLLCATVGEGVAAPTPEGALPRRQIELPGRPSAAAHEPEPLPSEVRAHDSDPDGLRFDNDILPDALSANVEPQHGRASVLDTALKAA
jgi:hypothetical protein